MFAVMNKFISSLWLLAALAVSCDTQKKASKFKFAAPEPGTLVNMGTSIPLVLAFPDSDSIDSVIYSVDGVVLARMTDSSSVTLDTEKIAFGSRTLSARLYQGGEEQIAYSNIVVVPTPPQRYSFTAVNEYPHDPKAYTQGLEYESGFFYESTGQHGHSSLRKVNYKTGEVVRKVELDQQYFGEGLAIAGNQLIQLTWRENVGFVYNKNTFEKIREFNYSQNREGWGICFDGNRFIKSDGSSRLYFLNKDTFAEEGFIDVYNHRGPVDSLNELEYINGKLYANVYPEDIIVIIDPETGAIEGEINLIGINPDVDTKNSDYALNGIAYDAAGDRLFITGKNWSRVYEIALVER